ncbi:hypothetical protein SLI_8031 [Streptomyces lividans 1326]|uniref:Uncharacterized protein n=1 Tax=Streptomyces lividans 1326 TaxID=1200984 RepID=A0A7U9DYY6_STRLI|nr:hypothetical protein SLI_8031 [Streptomyces lividans 1326]
MRAPVSASMTIVAYRSGGAGRSRRHPYHSWGPHRWYVDAPQQPQGGGERHGRGQ